MIKNFLKAAAAIAISSLFVFATTSGDVTASPHIRAFSSLFMSIRK